VRRPKPLSLVLESHVEQAVVELLQWDGWHVLKMEENFSERKMKRTGEAGMPDRLALRYHPDAILWLEIKRPGKEPTPAQLAWHAAERARGALVIVIDSIEAGRAWYDTSGLRRR
jgi:hypothetical protein